MQGFSAEFKTPEQYIIDITYKIWEERGVGLIYDWYAADCPVRTPHGVTDSVEDVIKHTLETMHEFPNRDIFAEDVIIGDKPDGGFYSSHRARSTAVHRGDGAFGMATGHAFTRIAIADCLCRNNQIVGEWLIADSASIALQLGLDPVAYGRALGKDNPAAYSVGNDLMRERWSDPDGLTIVGDKSIAQHIIESCDAIWNDKNLRVMNESYDRAVCLEAPAMQVCYGRPNASTIFSSMIASIPEGHFEPHHLIVRQQEARAVRVALRWSYCGTHSGHGRYGVPTSVPLALLGISHFELRDGKIAREWMVMDETAVYAQIAAYE